MIIAQVCLRLATIKGLSGGQLQETSDLSDCQQGFCHQVLNRVFEEIKYLFDSLKFKSIYNILVVFVILSLTVQINLPLKL